MTTIAWDGRLLAADRQMTSANMRVKVCKLFETKRWWYAATGSACEAATVQEWLNSGRPAKNRPVFDEAQNVGFVVEKATGHTYFVEGKRVALVRIYEPFVANGSGRDFALAGMALGLDAPSAVKLAAKFDVFTSQDVDVLEIGRRA